MSSEEKKFSVDEWVFYCAVPDSNSDILREERTKAVILYVYYDEKAGCDKYRIFIDETGKIINTRAENLFPL